MSNIRSGRPDESKSEPVRTVPERRKAGLPLVYSCSGCSSAAQMANHIALALDEVLLHAYGIPHDEQVSNGARASS